MSFDRLPIILDWWEGSQKTTPILYKRCIFLRVNINETCFGHIWPSSGFMSIEVSVYKLREKGCDVEISHQIVVRISHQITSNLKNIHLFYNIRVVI